MKSESFTLEPCLANVLPMSNTWERSSQPFSPVAFLNDVDVQLSQFVMVCFTPLM